MILGQETLGFRRAGFSPALSLLMPAFSLPAAPLDSYKSASVQLERSPTAPFGTCGFGVVLEPRYIYGAG